MEKRRRYRGREREREEEKLNNYSMRVKILIGRPGREEMKRASLSYLLVFTDIGKEGKDYL